MNRKIFALVPCLALALAGAAVADELDNPTYTNWAQFKPGAMVEYKSVSDVAGNKTETIIVYTLKEVTAEKAVVEMKTTMMMAGQKFEQPPMPLEHPAKVQNQPQPEGEQMKVEQKEGSESIDAAGQKWDCKWYETTSDQNGMKTTSRTWTNDDVPGTLVKSVTNVDGAMKMTTETVLVSVKAEKK